jgi:hypothetical protein
MKFDQIKNLKNEQFRRLTGVMRPTFDKMIELLLTAEQVKKALGGAPNKVSLEDRLLMALEYIREYRTYFHISQSYGISESSCYHNIKWIEDTLIKSKIFSLPGKKELLKSDFPIEVILIDATESPIERPKKNKNTTFLERKSGTL